METGINIARRYAEGRPSERIKIMCQYFDNFEDIIDGFEIGVFHLISAEKAYNRQKQLGDLGVRVQSGGMHSDRTANEAINNVMIMDAMRTCDFANGLLDDTDDAETHRKDILTIKMMREEYSVVERHLRRKSFRMIREYISGEKGVQEIADSENMLCESVRNKLTKSKKELEMEVLPFFKERL